MDSDQARRDAEATVPPIEPIRAAKLTRDELDAELRKGYDAMRAGNVHTADDVDAYLKDEFGI